MLKNLLIIQARMGSKRFPEKIFKKIDNLKSIELQIKRLKKFHKFKKEFVLDI